MKGGKSVVFKGIRKTDNSNISTKTRFLFASEHPFTTICSTLYTTVIECSLYTMQVCIICLNVELVENIKLVITTVEWTLLNTGYPMFYNLYIVLNTRI